MSEFRLWFLTGVEHITDVNGYDHILFVTLLVLSQPIGEWKKLLVLITGFTLGHCVTLALAATGTLRIQQPFTEFLIALSIFLTALFNGVNYKNNARGLSRGWIFGLVVLFGLIHGMGFSYLLRSMLGATQNVLAPLLYFNLGLEAGQLLIVAFVSLFSLFLTRIIKCPYPIYKLTIVCITGLIALKLCVERFSELL